MGGDLVLGSEFHGLPFGGEFGEGVVCCLVEVFGIIDEHGYGGA